MSSDDLGRAIEIYSADTGGVIWVCRDVAEPAVGDAVFIEQADGRMLQYEIKRRAWITAKQGESSFTRLRLFVDDVGKKLDPTMMIG